MDAAQDVKSRLDVADIVGEYLQLKPAGSGSFKALCPFHQEKTPSFYVNRPRQSWHCFGCDQGGDIISFVERMEGMEFPEALTLLAEKAGVTLPKFDAQKSSDRKRLHEVNDLAARFFRSMLLQSPLAEQARAYIKKRGLDDLTIDLWRLGYAPESWDALTKALKEKDVTEDELIKAGLVQKSDRGGVYDRFRNRLMFPIADVHGNVVGFTARLIDEIPLSVSREPSGRVDRAENGSRKTDHGAKYVNTPETSIYKKSAVLYGLDKAKGEIKRQDIAVICEGNMDVIGSHQFNVTNVVCSSGTALTDDQLRLLKRFTLNLAIAFDADNAGNAATIRGLDLARALDFNIRIITLPPEAGKDPDDVVRKDPELWKQSIRDALPVIEWLYRNAFRGRDSAKPEEKKLIARDLLTEFARISDAVERDAWIVRLARDLGVSEESLREALRSRKLSTVNREPSAGSRPADHGSPPPKSREVEIAERILAALYLRPDLRPLAESLLGDYDLPASPDSEHLNYIAVLADREYQDQSADALHKEIELDCASLRGLRLTDERTRLEHEMRDAERVGDADKINDLLAQFSKLMNIP